MPTTATAPTPQRLGGELTAAAPSVSFPLQLEAGQVVTLTTSSDAGLDTVMSLRGPDGKAVAENDDQPNGDLSARIQYVVPASGRYTAIVSGYNNATGAFDLAVTYGVESGLSAAARTLREERVTFGPQRTEARYDVDLTADDILVASTFAFTANLDTTLTLLDANGVALAQNDDRGDGTLNSRLVYQAAAAGHYVVVASTYGGTGVGQASVSLAIDPNAEAPFNFASIEGTEFARHQGELNNDHSTQEYRVELSAGQTVLAVSNVTSGNLDTVLRLNGPDGSPVAMNDDRGDGSLNSAVAYTAARAGAYTFVMERFRGSESSGAFTLTLSNVDASVVDTLQALAENVHLSGPTQTIETQDFVVSYTTEGEDAATPDYARATADTLQSVLDIQVHRIGWAEPVRDRNGRYRAFIANADGSMGLTKPVQIVFDNVNTARVRETDAARAVLIIDNDFRGLNPRQVTAESLMRATVTHEFNHVIQFGYDAEEGLSWLYESTASWTETTTVGEDQDASHYVARDFAAPQVCWTTNEGGFDYSQWTLLQSLADSYGEGIVVRIWENTVAYDGFETMSRALTRVGTTIPDALARWRLQNFARDYALAPLFERAVRLESTIEGDGGYAPKNGVEQLGAHYIALHAPGRHNVTLAGGADFEVYGMGRRNGEIIVVRLGRGGVFDTTGLEDATLMVFNRAVPDTPGDCSAATYSLSVTPATGAMAAPFTRFSAAHFMALTAEPN